MCAEKTNAAMATMAGARAAADADDVEVGSDSDTEMSDTDFDDSAVYRYLVSTSAPSPATATGTDGIPGRQLDAALAGAGPASSGLQLLSDMPFVCSNLSAIYSMSFHPVCPDLLLCAGKEGMVALFNVSQLPSADEADGTGEGASSCASNAF